jgi:hypothetical protein
LRKDSRPRCFFPFFSSRLHGLRLSPFFPRTFFLSVRPEALEGLTDYSLAPGGRGLGEGGRATANSGRHKLQHQAGQQMQRFYAAY